MKLNRLKKDRKEEAALELKRRKLVESDTPGGKTESDAMDVVEDSVVAGAEAVGAPLNDEASFASASDHFGAGLPDNFVGEYELMGVVTHKGRSADSGHYIGWVRQEPSSDYWWRYDDDVVTEVTTAEILNLKGGGDWHTAYLNFYRYKGED